MRINFTRVDLMQALCCCSYPAVLLRCVFGALILGCVCGQAQAPIATSNPSGNVNIFGSDLAVLEAGEDRKDLPCTVSQLKPTLGFDLRFHAGYEVSVPLKDLAGSENMLTIVFRVLGENQKDEPRYFS